VTRLQDWLAAWPAWISFVLIGLAMAIASIGGWGPWAIAWVPLTIALFQISAARDATWHQGYVAGAEDLAEKVRQFCEANTP
jgi:hypothetical protein